MRTESNSKQILASAMQHRQVSMQLDLLTCDKFPGVTNPNKRELETLRISRTAWDAGSADRSIAATDWNKQARTYTDRPDEWDWYIYLVEDERFVNDVDPILRMEPSADCLNPNALYIQHLHLGQVDTKIGQIERGELHPSHSLSSLAVRRGGWDLERASIPANKWFDYQINRKYDDQDDWMICTCDTVPTINHEPSLSYCIRSGMHISDVKKTMNARTDELGALTLAHYHIRRDQWQSNQPSITADKWDIGKLWQDRTLVAVDLDAADWAIYNIPTVAATLLSDGETPAVVMQMMRSLMQADESWAWSWHHNLAMMAVDAGAGSLSANQQAASFMRQAFEVDMKIYRNVVTGLEVERDKQHITAQSPEKILSGLTALDVRHAIPIICADRRIDPSQLWIRRASWTADADSIQASELKLHQPIKSYYPEPTDWEIWVKPHQDRSCEIQPEYLMMQVAGELTPASVRSEMKDAIRRLKLTRAHFAIRRTEWPQNTYSLNGTEWKGFLGGYDSPMPDGTDWELWIYDEQSVTASAELPVPSQHCLTLTEWHDDNTLYLGEYRGYKGYYQIDWDAKVVCGDVYALDEKITTFGGNSVIKAKQNFCKSIDNYIARCQVKAQAEENLLGVVHD
jgi:hypothetical protein